MKCVVHYSRSKECLKLVPLTDSTHGRLQLAKKLRTEHGGDHHHKQQCDSIPDKFDPEMHCVHMNPCYKKFTLFISRKHKLDDTYNMDCDSNAPRAKRQKADTVPLLPKICFFCKRVERKTKYKRETCHRITTKNAEEKLKSKARELQDDVFLHIEPYDLIAKELQYHDMCYKQYLRTLTHSTEFKDTTDSIKIRKVEQYISSHVLDLNQAISISMLHELYDDGHAGDHRYRTRLKSKLKSRFKDRIVFVGIDKHTPEVVISKEGLDSSTILQCKNNLVKQAAIYLHDEILAFAESTPEIQWPPDIKELEDRENRMPEIVNTFFETLLKSSDKHPNQDKAKLLVRSFSSDAIHGVTKGKLLTLKHFLLGVGLHNMIGQKTPIEILSHLGHSIPYYSVCEIESAEAQAAQNIDSEGLNLSILPESEETVTTVFWADNFNMSRDTTKKETAFINTTHVVAFQEKSELSRQMPRKSISKEECQRKIKPQMTSEPKLSVNKKQEPPMELKTTQKQSLLDRTEKVCLFHVWSMLRMRNSKDQTIPMLSGWLMCLRKSEVLSVKKTEVTYLPPIPKPITEYPTLFKVFRLLQCLAKSANMTYVNITFDVGAAINAYKLLWFFPEGFRNVMIHLGDFHFLKENFSVIGQLVASSGFEDVIFQANLCSSGCLNGIVKGSHYNRCWAIHGILHEAMSRLLLERFLQHSNESIQKELDDFDLNDVMSKVEALLKQQNVKSFLLALESFKEDVRKGLHGKTAQFWLIYYLDIMDCQHLMHTAIHENDFQMRLYAWRFMIPYYFALDKINYARYGSYYAMSLDKIDVLYPGNRKLLEMCGVSVQGQDHFPLRTAIDQRGEQTINREAKVTGGIKFLNPDESTMLKWTLNRAQQAQNTESLKLFANINPSTYVYKQTRPSNILSSEVNVSYVIKVLKEEYINPFSADLNPDCLYMLSSGMPVDMSMSDEMLNILSNGKEACRTFYEKCLASNETSFHSPIKRKSAKVFSRTAKKSRVNVNGKTKVIVANRDILGHLLAISKKYGRVINFKKALEYPLIIVPLSLAFPNGCMRSTKKSGLLEIVEQFNDSCETELPPKSSVSAYIVDLMAAIRVQSNSSLESYEDFIMHVLSALPKNYKRVDLVCDSYVDEGLKANEHIKRGSSTEILVKSEFSKLPRDLGDFLKCGKNKTRLIELFSCVLSKRKNEILDKLNTDVLFFSSHNNCLKLSKEDISIENDLRSNQQEADTKVFLHAKHVLEKEGKVIIKSYSGDTDIIVLAIASPCDQTRLFLDSNKGAARKVILASDVEMSAEEGTYRLSCIDR